MCRTQKFATCIAYRYTYVDRSLRLLANCCALKLKLFFPVYFQKVWHCVIINVATFSEISFAVCCQGRLGRGQYCKYLRISNYSYKITLELGTPCYKGQNVCSQQCPLWRGSTVILESVCYLPYATGTCNIRATTVSSSAPLIVQVGCPPATRERGMTV